MPIIRMKLGMATTGATHSASALRLLMTNPASTFIRMCPAVIATNSRSARLNGRIRKLISSIGNSTTAIEALDAVRHEQAEEMEAMLGEADDQHDREAQDREHAGDGQVAGHRERMNARPAPTGSMPSMLANRMNMNSEKT